MASGKAVRACDMMPTFGPMDNTNKVPYCVNCKHHEIVYEAHACNHPNTEQQIDVVTGNPIAVYAKAMRSDYALCGNEAKWFEAK